MVILTQFTELKSVQLFLIDASPAIRRYIMMDILRMPSLSYCSSMELSPVDIIDPVQRQASYNIKFEFVLHIN